MIGLSHYKLALPIIVDLIIRSLKDRRNQEMSCIYGKILTVVGGSSNGRTADSGSVSRGSNPLPPAKERRVFEVEGP